MLEIADKLIAVQAPRLNSTAVEGDKKSLLGRIVRSPRIPSPPALALKVFQHLGQDECDIGDVVKLLALDPGLSAKILRAVNSSLYSYSRVVTNLRQAVVSLGINPLRSLILGLVLPAMQTGIAPDGSLRRVIRRPPSPPKRRRRLPMPARRP